MNNFIGMLDVTGKPLNIGDRVVFSKYERGMELDFGVIKSVVIKPKTRLIIVARQYDPIWGQTDVTFRFLLTETEATRLAKL